MSVATSYAKALFETAKESNASAEQLNQYQVQLTQLLALFQTSRELRIALTGAGTLSSEKENVIKALTKKVGVTGLLANFLAVLARKQRLSFLAEIRDAYEQIRLESEGGLVGELVSADPLDAADLESIGKAFGQKFGKKMAFRTSTDAALLAGMKITVDGVTYDGSLRSQLQQLRDQLVYDTSSSH